MRNRGVEVIRCEGVGLAEADDDEHLEYATAQGCTLVSHDLDFWIHHGKWLSEGLNHRGIVLISNQFQGDTGKIFSELYDLYLMIANGAGNLETDVYNQLYEVKK